MHLQSVQNYCFSLLDMQICDVLSQSSSLMIKLPNVPSIVVHTRGRTDARNVSFVNSLPWKFDPD